MSTTGKSSGSTSADPERPTRVLLDANALFLPFLGGTDLAGEVGRLVDRPRIGVPRSVLDELRRLEMRGEPHAREVLVLAARFPVVPNSGKGDAAILGLAVPGDIVVTADRELQRQLAARGVDVLAPRDRARLERRRGERPRAPRPARARGNG